MTVLDYDMLGGSDAIGKVSNIYCNLWNDIKMCFSFKVTLGKSRKKLEKRHWVEMVDNPRRPVIHWHQLREPDPGNRDQEERRSQDKNN